MTEYRKNSLYLDFSGMPTRPKLDKVHELISKNIKIDMSKINCIQPSMTKARIIIEAKTHAYVEELVAEHSKKHTLEHENTKYAIPLVPFDNTIEVKVADLPSYISNESISKHLSLYGEIVSITEEVWKDFWPGLTTGIRMVRMRIRKQIPSYVPMDTHTAFITYRNQVRTCRYCVRPLHIGRSCADVRRELTQGHENIENNVNNRLTLAQLIAGTPLQSPTPTLQSSPLAPPQTKTIAIDSPTEKNEKSKNQLVNAITDRIMDSMLTRARSSSAPRSSSTSRLLPAGNRQVAGTSQTIVQPAAITRSDISDGESENSGSTKRPGSPGLDEAALIDVRRRTKQTKSSSKQ